MKKRSANGFKDNKVIYKQKRVDEDFFKGYIGLVKFTEIKEPWIIKDDGYEAKILDLNYEWLEVYPDDEQYAITIMYNENHKVVEWYFDMVKNIGLENGIPYIDDLYLDWVIRENGHQIVLDEDELLDALNQKDITKEDFNMAYETLKKLQDKYSNHVDELVKLTNKLYNLFKEE